MKRISENKQKIISTVQMRLALETFILNNVDAFMYKKYLLYENSKVNLRNAKGSLIMGSYSIFSQMIN